MITDEHRGRHIELHRRLDELVADWIGHTRCLPSSSSVMELLDWSYEQTKNPTEEEINGIRKSQ